MKKRTFAIVGATESDPFNGKISTDSSVGKTLIGHKQGDKVVVEIPDGFINYEICRDLQVRRKRCSNCIGQKR